MQSSTDEMGAHLLISQAQHNQAQQQLDPFFTRSTSVPRLGACHWSTVAPNALSQHGVSGQGVALGGPGHPDAAAYDARHNNPNSNTSVTTLCSLFADPHAARHLGGPATQQQHLAEESPEGVRIPNPSASQYTPVSPQPLEGAGHLLAARASGQPNPNYLHRAAPQTGAHNPHTAPLPAGPGSPQQLSPAHQIYPQSDPYHGVAACQSMHAGSEQSLHHVPALPGSPVSAPLSARADVDMPTPVYPSMHSAQQQLAQQQVANAVAEVEDEEARAYEAPAPTIAWQLDDEAQARIIQMLNDESDTAIDPTYLQRHGDAVQGEDLFLTCTMRFMTLEWMSDVASELGLGAAVLPMANTLFDRYLSHASAFPRSMLQLLGGACLFVAGKIEGVLPHASVSQFTRLADYTFDVAELVRFERSLCQTLHFNLYGPTTQNFLHAFEDALPAAGTATEVRVRTRVHHLASYFIDLATSQYDLLRSNRSVVAAAALVLAYTDRGLLRTCARTEGLEPERLEQYAHEVVAAMRSRLGPAIDLHDLSLTIGELLGYVRQVAYSPVKPHQYEKYARAKRWGVSLVSEPVTPDQMLAVLHTLYYAKCSPAQ